MADIVTRLRETGGLDASLHKQAADEIERLRVERDGYIEGNQQTLRALAEANEIAQRYRRERDEARLEICMLRASSTNATQDIDKEIEAYAEGRGWKLGGSHGHD